MSCSGRRLPLQSAGGQLRHVPPEEDHAMTTGEHTYSETEIAEKLTGFPGWYYEDG